jgi:FkbM family methyltransferase
MRNVALNGATNVTAIQAAVGNHDGEADLQIHQKSAYSTLDETIRHDFVATEKVEVQTLETVMKRYALDRVKLLKLDCEGEEYKILESLSRNVAQRIEQVALEVHEIPGRDQSEIPAMLKLLGFSIPLVTDPLMAFRQ